MTSHNSLLNSVWYHIRTNQSAGAAVSWMISSRFCTKRLKVYNTVNTNSQKHLFHNINMVYHANLTKQGLPWIRVNFSILWWIFHVLLFTLNCLSLEILLFCVRVYQVDFASVFGCSQLNHPWQFLFSCHAMFLMFDWPSEIRFFVCPMYSPTITT